MLTWRQCCRACCARRCKRGGGARTSRHMHGPGATLEDPCPRSLHTTRLLGRYLRRYAGFCRTGTPRKACHVMCAMAGVRD